MAGGDVLLREWPSRRQQQGQQGVHFSRMHADGRPAIQCPRPLLIIGDATPMQPPITGGEPWMLGLRPPAPLADQAPSASMVEEQQQRPPKRPADAVVESDKGPHSKRAVV